MYYVMDRVVASLIDLACNVNSLSCLVRICQLMYAITISNLRCHWAGAPSETASLFIIYWTFCKNILLINRGILISKLLTQ